MARNDRTVLWWGCCHVASWRPQTFATSVPVKPQRSLLAMSS